MTGSHTARPAAKETHSLDEDGTVQVPAFRMPFSNLATQQSRDAAVADYRAQQKWRHDGGDGASSDIADLRRRVDERFFLPLLEKQRAHWDAHVEKSALEIDGVYTDVFTPKGGVSRRNTDRILINVHGGGFQVGARTVSDVESLPIAGLGAITVMSVDYRMAPEHRFPAASEDLATVYRQLLTDHEPEKIGIYGSSAGGILAAQAVPWFLEHDLPLPGALGMFGGTGQFPWGGDSAMLCRYVYYDNADAPQIDLGEALPYFADADLKSALVAPILWPEVARMFPPSLLITGTRAHEMSVVADAHNRLTLAGAESRLHVWDGLGHCFYLDADLPESHEAERIVVEFFDTFLAA